MISFSCSGCGRQLKVKDELAGKKVRCSHCKQPVEAPTSLAEDATLPPSSVHESATLPPEATPAAGLFREDKASNNGEAAEDLEAGTHYRVESEIARGGMGAIMRAVDQDIQREVAVKFLLNSADTRQKARFVEEAQITGQLEHPNIVPIHQLGVHADGRCFFSMKMVKGQSLADILQTVGQAAGLSGEKGRLVARPTEYTLGRLLTIFVNVCNALSYAHSRQVVHRDLKPANIMVGDFGEVYVMDWGLAKVMKDGGRRAEGGGWEEDERRRPREGGQKTRNESSVLRPPSSVRDSNLTQAGAVMGTPAYMPPEQAKGEEVDERADIYALGAILYEILTLTPPVGRGGDMMAILMRVVEGQIDPPEKRAPGRWVPPELSAIAMKALAKDPEERYQTVEALQRDIQLFQEGRSVSAKQDTFWEMFKKLVKRNKGVSVTMGVLLPVLVGVLAYSAISSSRERAATARAYQDYQDAVKKSVPAFVKSARLAAEQRDFTEAHNQVTAALTADPENAEALLLKGQLLIVAQDFAAAQAALEQYLKARPDDAPTQRLLSLCRDARADDIDRLLPIANVLVEQEAPALVDGLLRKYGKNSNEARQVLLKMYRARIEQAWPGKGDKLTIDGRGLHLNFSQFTGLTDLAPLRGMPLSSFICEYSPVGDLSPLKGLPLTFLSCKATSVTDLSPLKGMPLTDLDCTGNKVADLSPLKGMPLTTLRIAGTQVVDLAPLTGMQLTTLECYLTRVADLAPLKGMPLTTLAFHNTQVSDISPLKGMPFTSFNCSSTSVRDLSPLAGMRLTALDCKGSKVTDLSPLKGMPLTLLDCDQTFVADLAPLQGMPLTLLRCRHTPVADLSSLKGAPLVSLDCIHTRVANLLPLQGMPLTYLVISDTPVADLTPLKGMPLAILHILDTPVTDLSPLQDLKLTELRFSPAKISRGLDLVRTMPTLRLVGNGAHQSAAWPPAEFWKLYDAGKLK